MSRIEHSSTFNSIKEEQAFLLDPLTYEKLND